MSNYFKKYSLTTLFRNFEVYVNITRDDQLRCTIVHVCLKNMEVAFI